MNLHRVISNLLSDLLGLLFPELCCGCNNPLYRGERDICTSCLYHLPYTDQHLHADNKTARKLWGRIPFHSAMALLHFRKAGTVQELMHHLKYKNRKAVGIKLGAMLGEQLRKASLYQDVSLIIPVPLHRKKERSRGYNQSMCIAEGVAMVMEIPILEHCLVRKVDTSSQTRKSRYKRYENMKDVFELKNPELVLGKNILLIDDVITTGATIEACAIVLQQAAIGKLSIAAIAFAD